MGDTVSARQAPPTRSSRPCTHEADPTMPTGRRLRGRVGADTISAKQKRGLRGPGRPQGPSRPGRRLPDRRRRSGSGPGQHSVAVQQWRNVFLCTDDVTGVREAHLRSAARGPSRGLSPTVIAARAAPGCAATAGRFFQEELSHRRRLVVRERVIDGEQAEREPGRRKGTGESFSSPQRAQSRARQRDEGVASKRPWLSQVRNSGRGPPVSR